MAEQSVQSSDHPSSGGDRPRRPVVKRVHFTWHGETHALSHFEDFMLEIGVDPSKVHTCCVPRQALTPNHHAHNKTKMKFGKNAARNENRSSLTQVSKPALKETAISSRELTSQPSPGNRAVTTRDSTRHQKPLTSPHVLINSQAQQLKTLPVFAIHPESYSASFAMDASFDIARDSLVAISQTYSIPQPMHDEPPIAEPSRGSWTSDQLLPDVPTLSPSEPIPTMPSMSSLTTRSRTSSIASIATASSSEGPETPRATSPLLSPASDSHWSLHEVEHFSRFRIPTRCVTCNRSGSNFPCCPKCGDMWCSRHCRMVSGNGGKHSCHCATMEPPAVYS